MDYLDALMKRCDSSELVSTPDERVVYASDQSFCEPVMPGVVLKPKSAERVQQILKIANHYSVPVVPWGSGTGTTGGALPVHDGILLSFEALNKVLDFDVPNKTITVQPGLVTGVLQDHVAKKGLYYPPDPASLDQCSIGGNVAENAGGPRAYKYGVTGDYVLGLKGFFASGEPFSFGGKLYKDVEGYDIKRLLVGSEGTLAVITEITLKLVTHPKVIQNCCVSFQDYSYAVDALGAIHRANMVPSAAEFIDADCMDCVRTYLHRSDMLIRPSVIFEVDGSDVDQVAADLSAIQTICERDYSAVSFLKGDRLSTFASIQEIRRSVSPALRARYPHKFSHDITVPPASIRDFLDALHTLSHEVEVLLLGYGHLGDGNIHVNILPETEMPLSSDIRHRIQTRLFELVLSFQGSITGEHGIGLTKKAYLPLSWSQTELELIRNLRTVFDPNSILNPGKIV